MKKKKFLTSLDYSDKDNLMGNCRITGKFRDNYNNIIIIKKINSIL